MRIKRVICDRCGAVQELDGSTPWPRRVRVREDLCDACAMAPRPDGLTDEDRAALARAEELTGRKLLPPQSRAAERLWAHLANGRETFLAFLDEMPLREALERVTVRGRLRYLLLGLCKFATVGEARRAEFPDLRGYGPGTLAEARALGLFGGSS